MHVFSVLRSLNFLVTMVWVRVMRLHRFALVLGVIVRSIAVGPSGRLLARNFAAFGIKPVDHLGRVFARPVLGVVDRSF